MKIVQSIQNLYNDNLRYYQILQNKTDELMVLRREQWHYVRRIKTLESFAMKTETGRFNEINVFEDFFASTLVVQNLSEIAQAMKFVGLHFDIQYRRPQSQRFTHKDSHSFPFDDLRLYVNLKDHQTGELAPGIYKLVFEIQIKTFLQHAWSIATHDLIYKSDKINWAKERVAYQVKASLEHAEISINRVEELSKASGISQENREVKRINQIIAMISKHWQSEDLPSDRRRLAQNVDVLIENIGITLNELNGLLTNETAAGRGTNIRNLSPYLIIVQVLFSLKGEKMLSYLRKRSNDKHFRVLITNELELPILRRITSSRILKIR